MEKEPLKYDQMVEAAMRGVVRSALEEVAENGLPGNHHFYISFLTGHPGVEMAEYLREMNPEEITIVIQHKYWGLEVGEDSFQVTLSFNKINERLLVPFEAITAFTDPSANFGLQFRTLNKGEDNQTEDESLFGELDPETLLGTGDDVDEISGMIPAPSPAAAKKETAASGAPDDSAEVQKEDSSGPDQTGEVITLDAFRKKTRKT